jgi:hypothetical protein
MEINGYDIQIPHRVTENTKTCILRVFRMFWPNMVVEHDKFGVPAFFVYETAEHKKNWDVEGWTQQSAHSMVDVGIDKDAACVTLTVEDPKHPATQSLITSIRSALRGLPR